MTNGIFVQSRRKVSHANHENRVTQDSPLIIGVTTGSDEGDMSPPDFGLEGTYGYMSPPDFGKLVTLYTQSMTHIKYEFDAMSSLSNNYK